MNCLIIEDEYLASEVLKDYIRQMPGLKLIGVCEDVFTANEELHRSKVDLIFLDINLPRINGMEFLKSLGNKYNVILTTAYHQYALDAFDLNVVDYLLKPIEFSRCMQAGNKVYEKNRPAEPGFRPDSNERRFYFFNTDKKNVKIYSDEIIFIESLKDYVRIHAIDKQIVTKFQIGELEKYLADDKFIRIHKSFIVNADKVTAFNAIQVEVGANTLPLGRTYKELVEKRLTS
jgi:DNA-binding LytR/AlgR family response regulator